MLSNHQKSARQSKAAKNLHDRKDRSLTDNSSALASRRCWKAWCAWWWPPHTFRADDHIHKIQYFKTRVRAATSKHYGNCNRIKELVFQTITFSANLQAIEFRIFLRSSFFMLFFFAGLSQVVMCTTRRSHRWLSVGGGWRRRVESFWLRSRIANYDEVSIFLLHKICTFFCCFPHCLSEKRLVVVAQEAHTKHHEISREEM